MTSKSQTTDRIVAAWGLVSNTRDSWTLAPHCAYYSWPLNSGDNFLRVGISRFWRWCNSLTSNGRTIWIEPKFICVDVLFKLNINKGNNLQLSHWHSMKQLCKHFIKAAILTFKCTEDCVSPHFTWLEKNLMLFSNLHRQVIVALKQFLYSKSWILPRWSTCCCFVKVWVLQI